MALINCPECGKEISDSSDVCIHCGFVLNHPKEEKKQKGRLNKYVILALVVVTVITAAVAGIITYRKVVIPSRNYNKAIEVLNSGDYDAAIVLLTNMGDYKDCSNKILEANYLKGIALFNEEKYEEAREAFVVAGSYQDALTQINKIDDIIAEQKAKAEAEAARKQKVDKLAKAYKECLGGSAKLSSDGTELTIDSENQYDIVSTFDIENACKTLGLPDTLYDEMLRTNSLMGKQTATINGFQISWSFHPDNGLDSYFRIVE